MQELTSDLATSLGLKQSNGALVADITLGSAAEVGGIRPGDVIIKFDGKDIDKFNELPTIVASTSVEKDVEVWILRKGKAMTLQLKVAEITDEPKATKDEEVMSGFVITSQIIRDLHWGNSQIIEGDVICEANDQQIDNFSDLGIALAKMKEREIIRLLIKRARSFFYITIRK